MTVPPPSQGGMGWVSYYYELEHFPLVGRYSDADCDHIVHVGIDEKGAQHHGDSYDVGRHPRHGRLHRPALGHP